MSEIFDHSEMSEEDVKHLYIITALKSKWDPKKITMETVIWKVVKKLLFYVSLAVVKIQEILSPIKILSSHLSITLALCDIIIRVLSLYKV